MAITVSVKIKCDRCDREQTSTTFKSCYNDEINLHLSTILSDANRDDHYGWKCIDRDGREVHDARLGPVNILCSICAEERKRLIEERKKQDALFFGGAK